ncbi:alpha/beta fold hydrolase [uncultured Massilia sp.]|uniref:alpha/beta fold hydrolase n=1 Tax=uncultured Massilia sp. TaxID=169973 RepID=UPI0025E7E917|nr:alpha/beta hydrolase [uncultured Massilia sp.]
MNVPAQTVLHVQGSPVWCNDAGRAFDPALPTFVLLHGALNDHSVWNVQAAWLAAHGWNVCAPDLPGHGRSGGAALASVEALADWVPALLDAAGARQAVLAGHSMGSLVALEAAARFPERVDAVALLGTAWPMKVADALLAAARDDVAGAIEMVAKWSHSDVGAQAGLREASRRLMLGLAARAPGLLHVDLAACNAYAGGMAAASALHCPVLFVMGERDRMTPPRSAQILTEAVRHGRIATVDAGHAMMAEQPDAVLEALAVFAEERRHAQPDAAHP